MVELRWIASQTEDEGITWFDAIPGEVLTPSADLPACWDEDPAHQAALAAAYPDPPEYPHPEDDQAEQDSMNAEPDWRGDDEWFERAW